MKSYAFGSQPGPSPSPPALTGRSTPGQEEGHTLAGPSRGDSGGVEELKRRHEMIGDREGDSVAEREGLGEKGTSVKGVACW